MFEALGDHECRPHDKAELEALLDDGWHEHRHVKSRTTAQAICSTAANTGFQAMTVFGLDGSRILLIRPGAGAEQRS